jgi:RNA polymerase sigma-70 factor (ECF subfamily)
VDERARQIEVLYRRHGPAIEGYLRRLFGQAEGTEDLLQETFLQAMRSGGGSLARAASPKAWLFGVARNVGMNARRRRRKLAPLPHDVAGPVETAEADPRLDRMRRAIAALPEAQREALGLRLHDEFSYEEIAAVTDVPVGTVRSRLHHAVRRLREALTAGGGNEART